jgi:hypothetical protein
MTWKRYLDAGDGGGVDDDAAAEDRPGEEDPWTVVAAENI